MHLQTLTPQQIEDLAGMPNPYWRKFYTFYFQAPKDMQEFAMADETTARLEEILLNRHGLDLDKQAHYVAGITWEVFFGVTPLKSYIDELVRGASLSVEQATAIARDINEAIFQPVKVSLMEVHGIKPTNGFPSSIAPAEAGPNPNSPATSSAQEELSPSLSPDISALEPPTPPFSPPMELSQNSPQVSDVPPLHSLPEAAPPSSQTNQVKEDPEAVRKREELLARLRDHVSDYETYSHEPPSISTPPESNIEPNNDFTQVASPEPLRDESGAEIQRVETSAPAIALAEEVPDLSITPPVLKESKAPKKNSAAGTLTAMPFDRAQDKPPAWNGKTIDLTKIPPRRETNKTKGIGVEHNGVKYVRLAKSKDGYWYEV